MSKQSNSVEVQVGQKYYLIDRNVIRCSGSEITTFRSTNLPHAEVTSSWSLQYTSSILIQVKPLVFILFILKVNLSQLTEELFIDEYLSIRKLQHLEFI